MGTSIVKNRIRNTEVYKNMRKISIILRERRLIFAGHCWRAKQPINQLIFWTVPKSTAKRGAFKTYIHILLEDWFGYSIKKSEHKGYINEIIPAMKDRDYWRENVKRICSK